MITANICASQRAIRSGYLTVPVPVSFSIHDSKDLSNPSCIRGQVLSDDGKEKGYIRIYRSEHGNRANSNYGDSVYPFTDDGEVDPLEILLNSWPLIG